MEFFENIYRKVVKDLELGLPDWLVYHNVNHTKYVLQQAESIAKMENIPGRDLFLVKLAALYHDTGFLIERNDHESHGCRIASKDLKDKELTTVELEKICKMIQATKIPQKPGNILEKIIADADLEYLGTDQFEIYSKKQYEELLHLKPGLTLKEWDKIQIDFLSQHSYHTDYCMEYKEPVKQKNLELVRKRFTEDVRFEM